MYRRMSGQLSAEETKQNGKYEATRLWGIQEWWHKDRYKKVLNKLYNKELFKVAALSRGGHFKEARAVAEGFGEDPIMVHVINHYQQKLCNYFGILKRYEHLPTWKQLSPAQKKDIGSKVYLQDQMNKTLQAEASRLQTEAAASLLENELKIAAELAQEEVELKTAAADSQSTDQPIPVTLLYL